MKRSIEQRLQANRDRERLIRTLERSPSIFDRVWLPLVRWIHRRELRAVQVEPWDGRG